MHIIGPAAWEPLVAQRFGALSDGQRAMAAAMLRWFHDRHVGLTPGLAAGLSGLLFHGWHLRRRRRLGGRLGHDDPDAPWSLMLTRLAAAFEHQLDAVDEVDRSVRRRVDRGLNPRAMPTWLLAKTALPLVARACREVGESWLFGEEGHALPRRFEEHYDLYARSLEQALERQLEQSPALKPRRGDEGDEPARELFWDERGLVAHGLSRDARRGGDASPPESDPLVLALMLRLRPRLRHDPLKRNDWMPRRRMDKEHRSGVRPKEDGVVGIIQSRRQDDLGDMVASELLNPKLLFWDRILNQGFLTRHRPPSRRRRRQVLFATLAPPARPGARLRLAKASWFHCVARLSIFLRLAGLPQSDFLWLEGDHLGGLRWLFGGMDKLPGADLRAPSEVSEAYLLEVLSSLRWLPRYVDRHSAYPDKLGGLAERDQELLATGWIQQALDQTLGEQFPERAKGLSSLDNYSVICLSLVLPEPADYDPDQWTVELGVLRRRLALSGATRVLSLLWWPSDADTRPEAPWKLSDTLFGALGERRELAMRAAAEPGDEFDARTRLDDAAGALVGYWTGLTERALFGG